MHVQPCGGDEVASIVAAADLQALTVQAYLCMYLLQRRFLSSTKTASNPLQYAQGK